MPNIKIKTNRNNSTNAAVIVAHPGEETVWAGGTILKHPKWHWRIVTLFGAGDDKRASAFHKAQELLHVGGAMGKLDDNPEEESTDLEIIQKEILSLLPQRSFDLIITHDRHGVSFLNKHHEDTCAGVINLIKTGVISTRNLWTIAGENGERKNLLKISEDADYLYKLPKDIWKRKREIITGAYGPVRSRFAALAASRKEAFQCFNNPCKEEIL
jgi:hypothetical protein